MNVIETENVNEVKHARNNRLTIPNDFLDNINVLIAFYCDVNTSPLI